MELKLGTLNYVEYKYLMNRNSTNMQLCPVFADPVTFFIVDTLVTEVLFIQVLIRDLPIMYEILPIIIMLKLCSIFFP